MLGVSRHTLKAWRKEYPALDQAIEDGRKHKERSAMNGNGAMETITKYARSHMPAEVRKLWDKINAFWEEEDPEKRVDLLLEGQSKQIRQHLFLHALVMCNFNKHAAARKMNLSYPVVHAWCRDEKFQQLVGSIIEMKKDFVEGHLLGLIAQGDSPATIFAAKTLLRDRGYDPKMTIEHKGTVTHGHVSLDKVLEKLDVASQKKILAAIRQTGTKALPAHVEPEEIQDAEWEEIDDAE
jgi:hypothetical protein